MPRPPAITYFDVACRAGPIREAARRLHVASSAMNRQILKLEAEIGTPLFDRLPTGLRLTPAGEVFARHVIAVLQDAERARSELNTLRSLRRGHVELATVGVTTMVFLVIPERVTQGDADIPELNTAAETASPPSPHSMLLKVLKTSQTGS